MNKLYSNNFNILEEKTKFLQQLVDTAIAIGKPQRNVNDPDNFILIQQKKYYFDLAGWQHIYDLLQESNKKSISEIKNVLNKDENLKINHLKDHIQKGLNNIKDYGIHIHAGPETPSELLLRFLKKLIIHDAFYGNVIYDVIYHRIHLANITNKLDLTTDRYLEKETILSYSIGKRIFQTYIMNTTFYIELFQLNKDIINTNSSKFLRISSIVEILLEKYQLMEQIPKNLDKELQRIQSLYKEHFSLEFSDTQIFHMYNIQLLIMVLSRIRENNTKFISYSWVLSEYKYSPETKKCLEMLLTKYYVVLGSLIVNELCVAKVFHLKQIINNNKRINYLEYNDIITENLLVSGTYFKHPLVIENLKNDSIKKILTEVDTEVGDKVFLEVSFNKHFERIHDNLTGQGELKASSPLQNEEKIIYTRTSIDCEFLRHFIDYLLDISKNINEYLLNNKERLSLYFSMYSLDICTIYKHIPSEFQEIMNKITAFALDLSTIADNNLHNEIKAIGDKQLCNKLKAYYYQIRSYKFIIRQVILEGISYSPFGYFLNLSFFDFRGRRYYTNPTFNPQGYSFIKAFVKLYENGTKSQFELIKKNVIAFLP
jgi:hypothetical protein